MKDRTPVCKMWILTFIATQPVPPTRSEIIKYVMQYDFTEEKVAECLDELANINVLKTIK